MKNKIVRFLLSITLILACSSPKQKGIDPKERIASDSAENYKDGYMPVTMLPQWANNLGIKEALNMELRKDMSQVTSFLEPKEGFNSVTLVYSGNYDTALSQARRIAKGARLTQSKEYKALNKLAKRTGHKKIKGIAYTNYDLSTRDIDFLIYVQVDKNGWLTLSATDMKQMNRQLNRHKGVENRKLAR